MSHFLSRLSNRITDTLERATPLDPVADAVQNVAQRLKTPKLTDLLSGRPMGHPAHPMLILVPLGTAVSAIVVDTMHSAPLLGHQAARRLVGLSVLSALPAAMAGLSDWTSTHQAERRVGLVHAGCSLAGVGLLAASWVQRARNRPGRATLLSGVGLLGASGWLGGHLAYALGVGVDTTAFSKPPQDWTDVLADSDLRAGQPTAVDVAGMSVLLVRSGERITAIGNRCTHRGGSLCDGSVEDGIVTCPLHGSQFALADGAVLRGPASRPQPAFETRTHEGQIQVRRLEDRALRTSPA